jgi:ATP-dependent protease ClpP protease subunit
MSTTGTGGPTAEALVEQPREGVADTVQQTEEQRLQDVERERMEKEKKEEAAERTQQELEKAEEPPGN